MLIIDTHAHIFPSLVDKFLPAALRATFDEWLQKNQLPAGFENMRASWMRWIDTLQKKPLDIETVAWIQGRLHPQIFKMVEGLLNHVLGPKLLLQGTPNALRQSMERHGIDKTVIIAAKSYAPNDFILECAKANPSLIPVCCIPDLNEKSSEREWFEAVQQVSDAGALGFKIHANMDDLPADHPGYRAFFEIAKKTNKFVILHTGCFHVPLYKRPNAAPLEDFEVYFKEFPDVRVCLAHMNRDHPEDAWTAMRKYEQLYADSSWQTAQNLRQALALFGSERLLFGSDWPLLNSELQGDALDILKTSCEDKAFEQIVDNNAVTFLGL